MLHDPSGENPYPANPHHKPYLGFQSVISLFKKKKTKKTKPQKNKKTKKTGSVFSSTDHDRLFLDSHQTPCFPDIDANCSSVFEE